MKDIANNRTPSEIPQGQTGEQSFGLAQETADTLSEKSSFFPNAAGYIALEGAFQNLEQTEVTKIVMEQLSTTFTGYETTVVSLNLARHRTEMIGLASAEEFTRELEDWLLTDKTLIQANEALEADPALRLTLLATPNIQVNPNALKDAVKAFDPINDAAKSSHIPIRRSSPYVDGLLYDKYSSTQISGTKPINRRLFQFALIPITPTPEMTGDVFEQRDKLEQLQKSVNPQLRVPSLLEAFTYWKTLQARGMLDKEGPWLGRITDIRHFNLPEQHLDGFLFVPDTFVNAEGNPRISGSDARSEADARLIIV